MTGFYLINQQNIWKLSYHDLSTVMNDICAMRSSLTNDKETAQSVTHNLPWATSLSPNIYTCQYNTSIRASVKNKNQNVTNKVTLNDRH